MNDIKEMENDFEDIYTTGLLQRYVKRTSSLEHWKRTWQIGLRGMTRV